MGHSVEVELRTPARAWFLVRIAVTLSLGCGGSVSGSAADTHVSDAGTIDVFSSQSDDAMTTASFDGASGDEQASQPGTDGGTPCSVDSDCTQPSDQYCVPCFDGGTDCSRIVCVGGSCTGHPANCPGPTTNPCAYKQCGDSCEQCATADGGCYPGTCNWFNECKAETPVCSISATYGCAPSDAVGVGDCNDFLGWGWNGGNCVPVVGCMCQGSDCTGLTTASASDCLGNYFMCPLDGG
jgi:hypothetical protein